MDAAQQRFYNHHPTPSQPEPVYGTYSTTTSNTTSNNSSSYPPHDSKYTLYDNRNDYQPQRPPYPVGPPYPVAGIDTAHLKDMNSYRAPSRRGDMQTGYEPYRGSAPRPSEESVGHASTTKPVQLEVVDQRLKHHIRILRLTTRVLALILSVLVFIPIAMTLIQYLTTRSLTRVVPPQNTGRGPWARESVLWPTYLYFGVASVSLLLNIAIMCAYWGSDIRRNTSTLRTANRTAYVAGTWNGVVMVASAVVWGVAASLYRTEKKDADLWGWACGQVGSPLGEVFREDVDFGVYCDVQAFSWYAGVVQALLAVLTCVVFYLVWRRERTKKALVGEEGEGLVKG